MRSKCWNGAEGCSSATNLLGSSQSSDNARIEGRRKLLRLNVQGAYRTSGTPQWQAQPISAGMATNKASLGGGQLMPPGPAL